MPIDFSLLMKFNPARFSTVCILTLASINSSVCAQQVPEAITSGIRLLAQDRVDLNQCVNHPKFGMEAGSGTRMGIDGQSLSNQIDVLANDMQYSAKGKLMYMAYTNALTQFEAIAKKSLGQKTRSDVLDIELVCNNKLFDPIKHRVAALDKQIQPYLK